MKFDAAISFDADLKDIPEIARAIEALGFDGAWVGETMHDPFMPLALVAEHTQRVEFGTAVAIAFARSPVSVAHTAWDLAKMSNGRLILGLGTQVKAHVERRFGMTWGPPVAKMREYIQALRAVWDAWQNGTRLNFRGEHYKLTLMTPFFSPPLIEHPNIPLYVAGVNMPMLRLAGEVADGLNAHPLHTVRYLKEVIRPALEEGARKANRAVADVSIAASVFVVMDDVEREFVRQQISFYASTPTYRPVFDLHGWAETAEKLSALAARGKWDEMPKLVTDEMLETVGVVGTWDDVAEKLKQRYDGLLQRIALYRAYRPQEDDEGWKKVIEGMKN